MFMVSFIFCDSIHVVFLSGSEFAQFFSFVYLCITVGDPVIKKGTWLVPIPLNGLTRTCISNVICHGLFCVQWIKV